MVKDGNGVFHWSGNGRFQGPVKPDHIHHDQDFAEDDNGGKIKQEIVRRFVEFQKTYPQQQGCATGYDDEEQDAGGFVVLSDGKGDEIKKERDPSDENFCDANRKDKAVILHSTQKRADIKVIEGKEWS